MKKHVLNVLLATALTAVLFTAAFAQSKPKVTILATGGTIAGSSSSTTDTTGYKAGALGIDVLINAVPEIHNIATVKGEQVSNTISSNISSDILLTISKRVNELLNKECPQGVVINNGTDTLEETAFFMA